MDSTPGFHLPKKVKPRTVSLADTVLVILMRKATVSGKGKKKQWAPRHPAPQLSPSPWAPQEEEGKAWARQASRPSSTLFPASPGTSSAAGTGALSNQRQRCPWPHLGLANQKGKFGDGLQLSASFRTHYLFAPGLYKSGSLQGRKVWHMPGQRRSPC